EIALARLASGRILAIARDGSVAIGHMAYTRYSDDDGYTWSAPHGDDGFWWQGPVAYPLAADRVLVLGRYFKTDLDGTKHRHNAHWVIDDTGALVDGPRFHDDQAFGSSGGYGALVPRGDHYDYYTYTDYNNTSTSP